MSRRRRPPRKTRHQVHYAEATKEHLAMLTARDRSIVFDQVDRQLPFEPLVQTRNRKPMEPNVLGASWELRVGDLRVYYDVEGQRVNVLAVGVKRGNRVHIGREEVEL